MSNNDVIPSGTEYSEVMLGDGSWAKALTDEERVGCVGPVLHETMTIDRDLIKGESFKQPEILERHARALASRAANLPWIPPVGCQVKMALRVSIEKEDMPSVDPLSWLMSKGFALTVEQVWGDQCRVIGVKRFGVLMISLEAYGPRAEEAIARLFEQAWIEVGVRDGLYSGVLRTEDGRTLHFGDSGREEASGNDQG